MSKLKGILLTEGMHGMLSQVEGLAKALDIEFTHHKVELNNLWKLIPSKFTPISQSVYKKINHTDYDFIISCGRKSIIPSIHLKSISNKKVLNIHIQDPKINLNYFDFIVAPEHDGINGSNVITTKGAIHYLSESEIEENKGYLNSLIKNDPESLLICCNDLYDGGNEPNEILVGLLNITRDLLLKKIDNNYYYNKLYYRY